MCLYKSFYSVISLQLLVRLNAVLNDEFHVLKISKWQDNKKNWQKKKESCDVGSIHVVQVTGWWDTAVNLLIAELNPICHLLVLLGDLTFMGPCIVSIFQYISNKMQRYTVYLYLKTALHVSGGTSTHHQERIELYLQHLVFVTPLLLSATIMEELEQVWVCFGWRTRPTAHSNLFQVYYDSGR